MPFAMARFVSVTTVPRLRRTFCVWFPCSSTRLQGGVATRASAMWILPGRRRDAWTLADRVLLTIVWFRQSVCFHITYLWGGNAVWVCTHVISLCVWKCTGLHGTSISRLKCTEAVELRSRCCRRSVIPTPNCAPSWLRGALFTCVFPLGNIHPLSLPLRHKHLFTFDNWFTRFLHRALLNNMCCSCSQFLLHSGSSWFFMNLHTWFFAYNGFRALQSRSPSS